jgi:hypothetical protein
VVLRVVRLLMALLAQHLTAADRLLGLLWVVGWDHWCVRGSLKEHWRVSGEPQALMMMA